jgi:hypothetical protein
MMTNKKIMSVIKNNKTRKIQKIYKFNNKKTKCHKYRHYKNRLVGGNDLSNDKTANEIMNEVKNERKMKFASLGNLSTSTFKTDNFPILKKTTDLLEGLTIKGLDHLAILLGVDFSNSQSISNKLEQIKAAINDPKNKEKVREIVNEAAQVGAVAIEAAEPFIKPLVDKTTELGNEALSKIGESAVKIGLNTAEEIPGVGVVLGTVRSLSDAGEAFLAASNAANEVITTTSDSINAATKNFERLMKEKMDGLNRINDSVNKFQQPFDMSKKIPMKIVDGYHDAITDLITFDKLQDLIADLKTKQKSIEGKIGSLTEQNTIMDTAIPSENQLEAFTQKALEVLPTLGFDIRQAIVRKLVDKIVANQQEMTIYGYLPIGKENEYGGLWSISRNSGVTKCG